MTTPRSTPQVLSVEELDFPTEWNRIYGKSCELVVEIGFGGGEYLLNLSQKYADALIIGIEISKTSISKALKKLKGWKVTNVFLLQMNAKAALWNLFKPESIKLIVSNFPDPWPKERHKHHRLFDLNFCKLTVSRLRVKGKLTVYTDDDKFVQWVLGNLTGLEEYLKIEVTKNPEVPPTRYAKKWQSMDRPIFLIEAVKTKETLYNFKPIERLAKMPNVVLKCDEKVSLRGVVEGFNELKSLGEPLIVISKVYLSQTREDAIFDVHLTEKSLTQRYFIEAKKRKHKLTLKVHDTTRVIPTKGVKLSLLLLARFFLNRGCEMMYSTVGIIS